MNIRDFIMPKLKFNKIKMDKATEELEKIQEACLHSIRQLSVYCYNTVHL